MIDIHRQRVRLMGFDAPELDDRARCTIERMLATRAAARLRQIIRRGDNIDLRMVACACRPGTEGTSNAIMGGHAGTWR